MMLTNSQVNKPKRRFRLLRGTHHQDGALYSAQYSLHHDEKGNPIQLKSWEDSEGDIIYSEHDLVAMFPTGKFEEIKEYQQPESFPSQLPAPEQMAEAVQPAKEALGGESTDLGKEVTQDYPQAEAQGLRVFKRGWRYVVSEDGVNALSEPMLKKDLDAYLVRST